MSEAKHTPAAPQVLSLPRTRRISLAAMVTEATHQLVLACWTGGLLFTASIVVPTLLSGLEDAEAGARLSLALLDRIGLLGCGAGSLLLLTTLLMHLLALRARPFLIGQFGLVLLLTAVATALQAGLAPRLFDLLRAEPRLFLPGAAPAALERFRRLFALYLALLLGQAALGAALMLGGVRRWYRYVPARQGKEGPTWS